MMCAAMHQLDKTAADEDLKITAAPWNLAADRV